MENELGFAIDVVARAADLTKKLQQDNLAHFEKEDKSPVTLADFSSQLLVSHFLHQSFPGDRLLAEENIGDLQERKQALLEPLGRILSNYLGQVSIPDMIATQQSHRAAANSRRTWALDPIDGTKGFLRGEQFVVALSLMEDNIPVLGVLGCPNLNLNAEPDASGPGVIAYAVKGKGAWMEESGRHEHPFRLEVSSRKDASQGRLVTSVDSTGHSNNDAIQSLKAYLGNQEEIAQFDSQAKYVMVAAGRYDLFLRIPPADNPGYREKVWDHAAGSLIVQEAGGRVSDVTGTPFDFSAGSKLEGNTGVVVSNGHIHQAVIDFLCTV